MAEIDMREAAALLDSVRERVGSVVVGQQELVDRLLMALICNGHVLIEGIPGIAKTLTVKVLAQALNADFSRVQFTPDLLPGDLLGTLLYQPTEGTFRTEKGPIFANVVLADEINRAPAKVQSALLEAMQEGQVTLGKESHDLPRPFLVMATQNPIEQEGTYELPEAQIDRFMFKLLVTYPTIAEEQEIMRRMAASAPVLDVEPVIGLNQIVQMRKLLDNVRCDQKIESYILRLVDATRHPANAGLDLAGYIRYGASPRATIYLLKGARARACLNQRDFIIPEDVKDVAVDILRHRIAINYRAEAAGMTSVKLVEQILAAVEIDSK